MKELGVFFCILLSPFLLRGQGNLQFNQVLNFQGELFTGSLSSPVYIVPDGRVWKIEYFTPFKKGPTDPVAVMAPYINGFAVSEEKSSPLWLKAGSSIQYINSNYFTSTSALYQTPYYKALRSYHLSIIEYNVIP